MLKQHGVISIGKEESECFKFNQLSEVECFGRWAFGHRPVSNPTLVSYGF